MLDEMRGAALLTRRIDLAEPWRVELHEVVRTGHVKILGDVFEHRRVEMLVGCRRQTKITVDQTQQRQRNPARAHARRVDAKVIADRVEHRELQDSQRA